MRIAWRCLFRRHTWTDWRAWWEEMPVIVRSSMECLNDKSEVRDCTVCGKRQRSAYSGKRP